MLFMIPKQPIQKYLKCITTIPYHWHNDVAILEVIRGTVCLRKRGKDYKMQSGDVQIINIDEIHSVEAVTIDNEISIIFLDQRLCDNLIANFSKGHYLVNSSKYEHHKTKNYQALRSILKGLHASFDKNCYFAIHMFTRQLITCLYYNFNYLKGGKELTYFNHKILERSMYLYENGIKLDGHLHNHSLKEISELIGVSYAHLRKDILERYGCGYRWLKYTVMTEEAARMIASTNLPVTSVCLYCGFSDPKYMIQYFKLFYNMTPSDFRKLYRRENKYVSKCCWEFPELFHEWSELTSKVT